MISCTAISSPIANDSSLSLRAVYLSARGQVSWKPVEGCRRTSCDPDRAAQACPASAATHPQYVRVDRQHPRVVVRHSDLWGIYVVGYCCGCAVGLGAGPGGVDRQLVCQPDCLAGRQAVKGQAGKQAGYDGSVAGEEICVCMWCVCVWGEWVIAIRWSGESQKQTQDQPLRGQRGSSEEREGVGERGD